IGRGAAEDARLWLGDLVPAEAWPGMRTLLDELRAGSRTRDSILGPCRQQDGSTIRWRVIPAHAVKPGVGRGRAFVFLERAEGGPGHAPPTGSAAREREEGGTARETAPDASVPEWTSPTLLEGTVLPSGRPWPPRPACRLP